MSFLTPAAGASGAATGLGHLLGADPSRISSIASSIGTGMNGIAAAGGATPGYAGQQPAQPNNFMQLSNPEWLRTIMAQMGGQPKMNTAPVSYAGPNLRDLSASLPRYAQ